nr:MAG TPA: hypothetical protein [Caudoviricetes sp.]
MEPVLPQRKFSEQAIRSAALARRTTPPVWDRAEERVASEAATVWLSSGTQDRENEGGQTPAHSLYRNGPKRR